MINPTFLGEMIHSGLGNYVLPGLSSFLVGGEGRGMVRAFVSERDTLEHITPHSHRFDFYAFVVSGIVENTLWAAVDLPGPSTMMMAITRLQYANEGPGKYSSAPNGAAQFCRTSHTYTSGEWYFMRHDEIHSIKFSKGAVVLMFEGVACVDETVILEPYVNGRKVDTFKVEDWMFQPLG